jgi:DNA polymerase sigma
MIAALCATTFLDSSELFLLLVGASAYYGFQRIGRNSNRNSKRCDGNASIKKLHAHVPVRTTVLPQQQKQQQRQQQQQQQQQVQTFSGAHSSVCVRQPSVVPVQAPTFVNAGWASEIDELLDQVRPTSATHGLVQHLVRSMSACVKDIFPEAELSGFVGADPTSVKAFAVAVPEIDIVLRASSDNLMRRVHQHTHGNSLLGERQVQKAVIRACTDGLVSSGGFKFRRSGFTGDEPKITFLAPSVLTGCDVSVSVDFSVNAVTPARSSVLLEECGRLDVRALDLILLVRRWARDRGVAHSAKGHLPPYAWTVLVVYFLQNHQPDGDDNYILPALDELDLQKETCHEDKMQQARGQTDTGKTVSEATAASLFVDFFHFFALLDPKEQVVAIRCNTKTNPVAASKRGPFQQKLIVIDPFEPKRNLCANMTTDGFVRFKEEVERARDICSSRSASVSKLLEPWAPPDEMIPRPQASKESGYTLASRPGSLSAAVPHSLRPNGNRLEHPQNDAVSDNVVLPGSLVVTPPWRAARLQGLRS